MIDSTADLIDRDPALPGMAVLLSDPRVDYLRYKPGTSLTVGLRTDQGPAFGYAVSESAAAKLDKIIGHAPPGAIRHHDRHSRLVLADPVADRDLPGIGRRGVREAEPLAYKPQRRWVAALDAEQIARCYRRDELSLTAARWPGVVDPAAIRIPAVVDLDRRAGLMAIERLRGGRLDRLADEAAQEGWFAAGRALGHWHRSTVRPDVRAELPDVLATAEQLAVLLPEFAGRFRAVAARLSAATVGAESGWCHGDFSADQLLIDRFDHRPAVLDWDRSGHGPVAFDLGTADAAGGVLSTVTDGGAVEQQPGLGLPVRKWETLLAGYTEVRELPAGLDRVRALAWFVRAVEPFRRADPGWPTAVLARVDRAEELLQ